MAAPPLFEFRLPDIGEGVHEAEIVAWRVKPGDMVAEDQALVEVETDKVVTELPSPVAGTVQAVHFPAGETVKVGSVLVTIAPAVGTGAPPRGGQEAATRRGADPGGARREGGEAARAAARPARWAPAAPSTRRLARELSVDVNAIQGTGPGGRVTDDDVRRAASTRDGGGAAPAAAHSAPRRAEVPPGAASPGVDGAAVPGVDRRVALRGVRKAVAEAMVRSKFTAPHATHVDEADASRLVELRRQVADARPDLKVTYLPFIIKAVVAALRDHPHLNAWLDEAAGEIVLRGEYHIGIAVDTDAGLMVPVIKHADRKGVLQLAAEVADLAERARARRLGADEVRGGTFSITSAGPLSLLSVPIIRHPEVAILGVHRIHERPVARDGQVIVRPMLYLSLSFDHRVLDGAHAARFTGQVIRYLENPMQLFADRL